jgi:hypothetical protein
MEDLPSDVVKDILLLLNVGDLLHVCQSGTYLYNICQSEKFWLQYLISKYQDISIAIIQSLKNEYTGYKQMAIELDNGIVVPVVNGCFETIGHKIVNYNKSFGDNFLQMIVNASNTDNYIRLTGQKWTIYAPLFYTNQTILTPYSVQHLDIIPRGICSVPATCPQVSVGGYRIRIPTCIPLKNISKERFDIIDLCYVHVLR